MPFFNWSPSLSVGVKELDDQHQKLIDMVNRLHDGMKNGKGSQELGSVLGEMVEYAKFHFSTEEKILSTHAYPSLIKQKLEHDAFTKKALEFQTQHQQGKLALSINVLTFLKDWLNNHIQVEDQNTQRSSRERASLNPGHPVKFIL
jgi:hemerythrin